ncbi:MAG: SDR family oxidoreductase [Micropruina sp.]|uniref:SDR family oxidoreductase n=1 Tax=Micropruina sp. TaxID=2737536 RepID=UPI0039E3848F
MTPAASDQTTDQIPAQQQQPPGLTDEMRPRPDHGEQSYRGDGRLTGKRALITGGDSGIGRAVAIAFAREGADVAINYLEEEEVDAAETASWVERAGRRAVRLPGDLTEVNTCRQLVDDAVSALGGLDILVNNAGFHLTKGDSGTLEGLDPETVERVVKTNVWATLWLCQAALPHLGEGSAIINTSSIQAYEPSGSLLDYAATKSAINSITVNLAQQLGAKGIRVNAVAPGPIWTPLQPATRSADEVEGFGADSPLGRPGQPAEVAPAFVFLAAESTASYVSGSILGVTGGKATF